MASARCFLWFFDTVEFEPANEVLDRQLLGQQLLIGGAPFFPAARSLSISASTLSRSFRRSAYMRS